MRRGSGGSGALTKLRSWLYPLLRKQWKELPPPSTHSSRQGLGAGRPVKDIQPAGASAPCCRRCSRSPHLLLLLPLPGQQRSP